MYIENQTSVAGPGTTAGFKYVYIKEKLTYFYSRYLIEDVR